MNQYHEEREEWMYKPIFVIDDELFLKYDFLDGLDAFIEFATSQPMFMQGEDIKCPCRRCGNQRFLNPSKVRQHILTYGFVKNYYFWSFHGETPVIKETPLVSDHESNACHNNLDSDEAQEKPRNAKKKRLTNNLDDDEVQKKSRKAEKKPEKPGTSTAKLTEGSKCAQQHTIASAKEKGAPTDPVTWEAFLRLNCLNGVVSDPKSTSIAAEVFAVGEEMSKPLPGSTEPREVDMTAIYLDVSEKKRLLDTECCSSRGSSSSVNSGGSSELECERVKTEGYVGSSYEEMVIELKVARAHRMGLQSELEVMRGRLEEMQRRYLEHLKNAVEKQKAMLDLLCPAQPPPPPPPPPPTATS